MLSWLNWTEFFLAERASLRDDWFVTLNSGRNGPLTWNCMLFKWVDCVVCGLYLNKAIVKKQERKRREERKKWLFFSKTHICFFILLCLRMSFKRTSVKGEWKRPSSVIPPSFSPPSPPPPHSPIRGALSHMCVLPALRTHKAPLFLVLLSRCFCESRCR